MKKSLAISASLGDSVIIAVIALVVLNSVSNAGDCSRCESAVATCWRLIRKLTKKLKSKPDDVY